MHNFHTSFVAIEYAVEFVPVIGVQSGEVYEGLFYIVFADRGNPC